MSTWWERCLNVNPVQSPQMARIPESTMPMGKPFLRPKREKPQIWQQPRGVVETWLSAAGILSMIKTKINAKL